MRKKSLIAAMALSSAVLFGVSAPAFAAPVHASAVKPAIGPGWTPTQIYAYSGGGCAVPSAVEYLAPIISYPCSGYEWYFRYLDNEASVEFVNPEGTLAIGFSGGHFKLEVPNDTTTVFQISRWVEVGNRVWNSISDYTGAHFMVPNGKGLDVGVDQIVTVPGDGWAWGPAD
jgi:hypothetical protein